jgi:hypothetical protein
MNDRDIDRILAIASRMAGDDDLTVVTDEEPELPELFGGLTPYDLDYFDPVAMAHEAKRHRY